jgi:hypothetical protein
MTDHSVPHISSLKKTQDYQNLIESIYLRLHRARSLADTAISGNSSEEGIFCTLDTVHDLLVITCEEFGELQSFAPPIEKEAL